MKDNQFTAIFEILIQIEQNTRQKDYSVSNIPWSSSTYAAIDKTVKKIQELFFSKLQLNTHWTQNEIKQIFTESVRSTIGSVPDFSTDECPL